MPVVRKQDFEYPENWIPFNLAKSCKHPENTGIHFFLDDYMFNAVWVYPERYIELFRRFRCIASPNFSLYRDFPVAVQIYNKYRNSWLSAYYQEYGVNVMPCPVWSGAYSYSWCFDGYPKNGPVIISSVGSAYGDCTKELFRNGYDAMLKKLSPEKIFIHGNIPEWCQEDVIHVHAFQDSFKKRGKEWEDTADQAVFLPEEGRQRIVSLPGTE